MKNYIGLSLSFCILSILKGNMNTNSIIAIISNTMLEYPEDAFRVYYHTYWKDYPTEDVMNVLNDVWTIVFQPRLALNDPSYEGHSIANGIWVSTDGTVKRR